MKLKQVRRLDSIPLDATYFTEEGYLRDKPIVTTCGIFEYVLDDGSIRRELRLPEDVFEPASLESYRGKPIIVTHDAGEINKNNVQDEQVGTILSTGIKDGENVRADIIIHNTDVLKSTGLRELSLGYDLDLEEEPGTYEGQHYDARQRNIRINHLALVDEARAGSTARLNIDGKSNRPILKGGKQVSKGTKKTNTKGSRFDSETGLTPDQMREAVAMYLAAQSVLPGDIVGDEEDPNQDEDTDPIEEIRQNVDRRDSDMAAISPEEIPVMQEEIKTLLERVDELQAEKDMTQDSEDDPNQDSDDEENTDSDDEQNADSDDEENTDSDDEQNNDGDETQDPKEEKVLTMDSAERTFAEMFAISQMATKLNLDGFNPKSVMDGKKKIIRALNPKLRLDGKSKSYISGAYEVACGQAMKRINTDQQRRKAFGTQVHRDSSGKSSSETARERMIANMKKKGGSK
ncbi:MAG: DUF2213 domain-containing protein [Lachnospiraceae bacterium]